MEHTTQQSLLEHVRQLAAEVAELKRDETAPLTDNLAHWLAAQFLVAAKTAAGKAENGSLDLKTLHDLNADIVALRRGDHSAERLKVERKWLELERKNPAANMEKRCIEYARDPKNQAKIKPCTLTPEEQAERLREIFRREPQPLTPEQREERMRSVFGLAAKPQNGSGNRTPSGSIQPSPG